MSTITGWDDRYPDFEDEYEEHLTCDVCGSDLSLGYPEVGCPFCLPCGGQYAPGTEECDFCEYAKECSS